ncbi:MAG: SAM-dependent methyltransferase [Acetobacteraceae bacterium]|nr:SAM-dependent methyltransferase [Acetobacteraceae bacterium]
MARANATYYATRDAFADFTTAPEITQVFGEILGLWAAVCWKLLGSPSPVLLVEAGPGRGTLLSDALRAIGRVAPAFRTALQVHLIETSPRLRAMQVARVADACWHDTLASVPWEPILLLANEFLDALPIRQFVRRGGGWTERFVTATGFSEIPSDPPPCDLASIAKEGGVVEICEPANAFVAELSARLMVHPGAALFLDYGPDQSTVGDSLQAIAGGRPADPLGPIGCADLTAHVDFAALAKTARSRGAIVHGPKPQGRFLAELGLFQRTDRLARTQPPRRAAELVGAAQRLAEPNQMGRLFKAMALASPGAPVLPGFET